MNFDNTQAKKKPIIAVIPLFDDQKDSMWMLPGYFDGIAEAGGVPIMLPLTDDEAALRQCVELCSGVVFTGGQDISPALYGEEKLNETVNGCPARDTMEAIVLKLAMEQDKAILGICRGVQFINVSLGGSLYQDLPTQHPSEVCHRQTPPYNTPIHSVALVPNSPLAELLHSDTLTVNSYHHQAIKVLAPGLEPMAISPDGLVEAVCRPASRFLWAVQWHPECLHKNDPDSRAIFRRFVEACRE